MTVHFIGAGPGAPDLITLRGLRLIQKCPVCLYAGSLVPEEIVKAPRSYTGKFLAPVLKKAGSKPRKSSSASEAAE